MCRQAEGPPTNPVEMGLPDIACAVRRASQRSGAAAGDRMRHFVEGTDRDTVLYSKKSDADSYYGFRQRSVFFIAAQSAAPLARWTFKSSSAA
jgi:hypothetical protein